MSLGHFFIDPHYFDESRLLPTYSVLNGCLPE